MPTAAKRYCSAYPCGAWAVRHGRCRAHQTVRYREQQQTQGTAAARGYDADWRKVRARLLRQEPCCRACAAQGIVTLAVEADHIVPLAQGGARLDLDNIQPLCRACHADKTARENGRK